MTSRAAPLFTVAATEAANDPPSNVTTEVAPTHIIIPSIPTRIASFPERESKNDDRYDPTAQRSFVAKVFLTALLRATATHGHRAIDRETIDRIFQKYRWILPEPPFWVTLTEEIRSSIRFSPQTSGATTDTSLVALNGTQIQFIAEECWNAILSGSIAAEDVARLLEAKKSFHEWCLTKSDDVLLKQIGCTERTLEPQLFLSALSSISDRGIRAVITRFPSKG